MTDKIVGFDVVEVVAAEHDESLAPRMRDTNVTRSGRATAAVRAVEVPFTQLSENFSGFVDNVRGMLARVSEREGNFAVEKVEIQAQINGEGKVGFMGNGVKASGGASIKIILERRKDKQPAKDPE